MRSIVRLSLVAAAALPACINTDTAVFVDPTIAGTPTATVTSGALGAGISGGAFHLNLHLGARASGPSQVTLGEFQILDAGRKAAIVTPLLVDAGATMFPATVQPDSDLDVDFTFDTGTKTLPADVGTKLCDPAGVVIGGTIDDPLKGGATPFYSDVFHPSCM
jgi:hypothetical protein